MCQSLLFNKVAGLRPEACNFITKKTLVQVFFCEFCEMSRNTFFIEHLWATASVNKITQNLFVQSSFDCFTYLVHISALFFSVDELCRKISHRNVNVFAYVSMDGKNILNKKLGQFL